MACCILHIMCIFREVRCKYAWIIERKDIHILGNSEEDDVDIVDRNLAGAADAKEIRKALTVCLNQKCEGQDLKEIPLLDNQTICRLDVTLFTNYLCRAEYSTGSS